MATYTQKDTPLRFPREGKMWEETFGSGGSVISKLDNGDEFTYEHTSVVYTYTESVGSWTGAISGSTTTSTTTTPTTPTETGPKAIQGYYPLYDLQSSAVAASSSSSAHTHDFNGVTYYMPTGGTLGTDYYHGNYGQSSGSSGSSY